MDPTRVVQNPLRQRRLPGVDVRRDPNVAEPLHRLLPPGILLRLRARRVPGREVAEMEGAADEGGRRRPRRGGGAERVEEARGGGPGYACHGGGEGFALVALFLGF